MIGSARNRSGNHRRNEDERRILDPVQVQCGRSNASGPFAKAQFPDDQGLYVCKSRGHRFEGPHGLQLRAITGRGRLTGIGLWVCGYELILSMSGFSSRSFDGRKVAYRPLEFYATGQDFEKSVVFCWDGTADLGTVSVEIVGT